MQYSRNFYLNEIQTKNINQKYFSWMKNSYVNFLLETRFKYQTLESLKEYLLNYKIKTIVSYS